MMTGHGRGRGKRSMTGAAGLGSPPILDTCLKTLLLNPPSFERFDGGAGSRWPATREIESYWYPVWLAYPSGMIEGSRLLDAPPHHISADETIEMAKQYEFLVLYTSTPGFPGDIRLSQRI